MSRHHETWTERFSEYLDGGMDPAERTEVERHLASCGPCRRVLEELRGVVARAAELGDLGPPRDLWPGIEAVIRRPRGAADVRVIELPVARREAPPAPQRVALTRPQLAAAAVVLIAVSAATTWWVGPGLAVRGEGERIAAPAPATAVSMASDVTVQPPNLAAELADLETLLDSARATLDPNTVRVLERNLAVIEQAIADSQRALALDPENEFLAHHLERVFERKLVYLRDAARVLDWAG